jgi:hypothetical protein
MGRQTCAHCSRTPGQGDSSKSFPTEPHGGNRADKVNPNTKERKGGGSRLYRGREVN